MFKVVFFPLYFNISNTIINIKKLYNKKTLTFTFHYYWGAFVLDPTKGDKWVYIKGDKWGYTKGDKWAHIKRDKWVDTKRDKWVNIKGDKWVNIKGDK